MAKNSPIIVWLRYDLRLYDNPALHHACLKSDSILPIFILDDITPGSWKRGAAARWWLHHSLRSLQKDLEQKLSLPLILKKGNAAHILPRLIEDVGADGVYWNRNYEPWSIARDKKIKATLIDQGIDVQTFNGRLLFEPWEIENKSGQPFRVFTPFWKTCMSDPHLRDPYPIPSQKASNVSVNSDDLNSWDLLPTKPDWSGGMHDFWDIGEAAALKRFDDFVAQKINTYKDERDFPAIDATSLLSPHLHFGEISPLSIWHKVKPLLDSTPEKAPAYKNIRHFISEIGWREFSYHLLFHYPKTPDQPLYDKFQKVPWDKNEKSLNAWQKGLTGIPIVDAGMRQLWQTGWMHNRLRMLVGSLLVKNILIDWRAGEQWFWDCLVDADLANNTQGWQWVAGCGADAAPYFRIFNPVTQGERFDPDGNYVRRYVPELKNMPKQYIHKPWEAGPLILKEAGVTLGQTYPNPIVNLKTSREKALEAFAQIKKD